MKACISKRQLQPSRRQKTLITFSKKVTMAGKWYSEDDFEKDFWSMAEISSSTRPTLPKPTSSKNSPSRTKPKINSIYLDPELMKPGTSSDKDSDDDDEIICRVPARGRLLNSILRRPGGKLSDSEHYKQVHSAIRQVAGSGYSNELIEHAFKNRDDESDDDDVQKKFSKIHFQSATNRIKANNSNKGSPTMCDDPKDKSFF